MDCLTAGNILLRQVANNESIRYYFSRWYNYRMRELSEKRAIAAMPVGGGFRAIDFALSNMSNSHIQRVAVLTQYNSRSLNEHLNSSKWWDFGRKQGGLYIFTPTITAENGNWYRGTADALAQNIDFLKRSHEPYVIVQAATVYTNWIIIRYWITISRKKRTSPSCAKMCRRQRMSAVLVSFR